MFVCRSVAVSLRCINYKGKYKYLMVMEVLYLSVRQCVYVCLYYVFLSVYLMQTDEVSEWVNIMRLSVCLSSCLSFSPSVSVCLSVLYLSVDISDADRRTVGVCECWSICPSVWPSVRRSFVRLSVRRPSVHLFVQRLSIRRPSVRLSIHP